MATRGLLSMDAHRSSVFETHSPDLHRRPQYLRLPVEVDGCAVTPKLWLGVEQFVPKTAGEGLGARHSRRNPVRTMRARLQHKSRRGKS